MLRNPLDRDVTKPPGVALQLFNGGKPKPVEVVARARLRPHPPARPPVVAEVAPPPPPPTPKKKAPFAMEIILGGKKLELKFEPGAEGK